jgi:predicted lipid-binding transport protein (Tim44 family)
MSLASRNTTVSAAESAAAGVHGAAARAGGGKSYGSRGSRTYTAPKATRTAPGSTPIEQSMTDKRKPAAVQAAASDEGTASPPFFAGWRILLVGSVVAASAGSIFGFGPTVNVLGFLLELAFLGGAIYFVVNFLRNRDQTASVPARGSGESPRGDTPDRSAYFRRGAPPFVSALTIDKDDFDSFERLLGEIQIAYGQENTDVLGARTTPEMFSYFSREIFDNQKQSLRHDIRDVQFLAGELSEAWHENGSDYATLALHYASVEASVERATGEPVPGDSSQSSQTVELWTFRRDDRAPEDGWQLSAIQQGASR